MCTEGSTIASGAQNTAKGTPPSELTVHRHGRVAQYPTHAWSCSADGTTSVFMTHVHAHALVDIFKSKQTFFKADTASSLSVDAHPSIPSANSYYIFRSVIYD